VKSQPGRTRLTTNRLNRMQHHTTPRAPIYHLTNASLPVGGPQMLENKQNNHNALFDSVLLIGVDFRLVIRVFCNPDSGN
jgi:hypothetical protein